MAQNGDLNSLLPEIIDGDFLKCPVCQDDLKAPKILPCLHSFCFECLKNSLAQSNIGNGQSFLCPLCKLECTVPARGVAAMKTNIFAVTLQEYIERRSLASGQVCEGCDSGARAKRKCLECNDWLCSQCCHMHKKVRMTSDHQLVSASDLQTGKYDQLIKDTFEPLYCSIHGEPLKLYCTDNYCRAPICTVCKSTPGHDGHLAIELDSQGRKEANYMAGMMNEVQRSVNASNAKIGRLKQEDKVTSQVCYCLNLRIFYTCSYCRNVVQIYFRIIRVCASARGISATIAETYMRYDKPSGICFLLFIHVRSAFV